MGMTDSQFKAFIRFILDALNDMKEEPDKAKQEAKLGRILENLQKALED